MEAQAQERAIAAFGVQAAVADLLVNKGKAMKTYLQQIGASEGGGSGGAANPHTEAGAALGTRIKALLAADKL